MNKIFEHNVEVMPLASTKKAKRKPLAKKTKRKGKSN